MDGFETNRLLERIRSLEVENGLLKKRLEEAGISYDDITGAGPGFNIPTDESPDDPDNHYDPDQGDRIHPFEVTDKVANTFFMMFCRGRKDVYDLRYS